jgi:hypothetical protein
MTDHNLTSQQLEAARILSQLTSMDREELKEKSSASINLIESISALSEAVGFVVTKQMQYTALSFSDKRRVVFSLGEDDDIVLTNANKTKVPLAIEYDRLSKQWVGTEVDPNVAPTPGLALPKKQALVVLAEAVVRAITELEHLEAVERVNEL